MELDAESKAWVDTFVPEIVSTWDKDKFTDNANYRLLDTTNEEGVTKLFAAFNEQYGALKKYHGSEGQARISINNTTKTITGEYSAYAEFEGGKAKIEIVTIKEEEKWTIARFFVTPIAHEYNL